MITNERAIDPDILQKVMYFLQERFATKLKIIATHFLSEPGRRNIVLRLTLESKSSAIPKSLILKQSLLDKSDANDKEAYARFARDWAGLEFTNRLQQTNHNAPRFYGGNKEHRFILIEDLGQQHISLVDAAFNPG